jgi:hypothetical protein
MKLKISNRKFNILYPLQALDLFLLIKQTNHKSFIQLENPSGVKCERKLTVSLGVPVGC